MSELSSSLRACSYWQVPQWTHLRRTERQQGWPQLVTGCKSLKGMQPLAADLVAHMYKQGW